MKRFLMCLLVAVAAAGCGGDSSDELEAALARIEELEAAQGRRRDTINATDAHGVASRFLDHDCAADDDDRGAGNHDHGARLCGLVRRT